MLKSELIDKIDAMTMKLNGVTGRLMVASMRDPVVKEAMEMVLEVSNEMDDIVNDLMINIIVEDDIDG